MRGVGIVLAVVGVLGLAGAPASAQPDDPLPPELTDQLARERIVRLPGATVTVDDGRISAGLSPQDRVLIAPAGGLDGYGPHFETLLLSWALKAGVRLTVVEGLWIARLYDGHRKLLDDSGEQARWRLIAYGDATDIVLGTATEEPPPVPATDAQLDALAVNEDRPGVRLATAPAGPPFINYASGLAKRFPDELIAVAHGGWLEFAGPGRERATYLRDVAYAAALTKRGAVDLVDVVLDRVVVSPRPVFDASEPPLQEGWSVRVNRVVPMAAGGAGVIGWLVAMFVRRVRGGRSETDGMRLARAEAFARIEELSASLLDTEDPDSRAGERYATARTLFDQAQTADAMAEVGRIADEGLELTGGRS